MASCHFCSFCSRLRTQTLRTLWAGPTSIPLFLTLLRIQRPERRPPRSKKTPLPQKQILWEPWKDLRIYRYRTGSRYAGRGNWERYVIFESHEKIHFSEISCGSVKAPDVSLSPSNPVAKIVLLSTSASRWKWNASLSSTPKVPKRAH